MRLFASLVIRLSLFKLLGLSSLKWFSRFQVYHQTESQPFNPVLSCRVFATLHDHIGQILFLHFTLNPPWLLHNNSLSLVAAFWIWFVTCSTKSCNMNPFNLIKCPCTSPWGTKFMGGGHPNAPERPTSYRVAVVPSFQLFDLVMCKPPKAPLGSNLTPNHIEFSHRPFPRFRSRG